MTTDSKSGPGQAPAPDGLRTVLVACALVATGHLLGARWLAETVLGLPAGIWLIGLTAGAFAPAFRRRVADAAARAWSLFDPSAGACTPLESAHEASAADGWWPANAVASSIIDLATRVAAAIARVAFLPVWAGELSPFAGARRRLEEWLASAPRPTRPIRVGLHMPDDEAEALTRAAGACRVEWFRLAAWDDPQSVCRRRQLDAVLYHDGEGPVRIVTLERPGRAAGVVEWADLGGPLTFGSLFPARVDPAAIVVEGATRTKVREGADLLRALVEGAAVLARSSHRLDLSDRLFGRRATDLVERPGGLCLWRSVRPPAADVILSLSNAAARHAATWPEAARLASGAAGAFFLSCPGLGPAERVESLSAAAGPAPADATAALRLAAACIGALEDERALGFLVKADALIRKGQTTLAPLDHAAFLESELMHGSDDPMSVGRAAAGICMVCAATPAERLPFVRDDMLEEMAYAGWLVGRDQDRSLLIAVFLEIEHAHALAGGRASRADHRRTRTRRERSAAA